MATVLDEMKAALKSFENSVKSDLEEIRKQKREVLQMRNELYNTVKSVDYVRNDGTVIISAPNIIIGNVDQHGNLLSGSSTVTIRTNSLSMEAAGLGGRIMQRASNIRSIAVDPGDDGLENVVHDNSEILCQAKGIALRTDSDKDVFVSNAGSTNGIGLYSDTGISIHATPGNKSKGALIDEQTKSLDKTVGNLKTQIANSRSTVERLMKEMDDLINSQFDYNDTEEHLRCNQPELADMHDEYEVLEGRLLAAINQHIKLISQLAEATRRTTALKGIKKELSSKSSSFDKKPTGSFLSLRSELMSMMSIDGDGNIRENREAGLDIQAPHINVTAQDKTGALIKDSNLGINTQRVNISTASAKLDDKRESGTFTALGDVSVVSKTVTVKAVDYELKNKKVEEKALTKDGKLTLRAENIRVEATDTEGKSAGAIALNAKRMRMAAMDLDKEKRTDKELAKDSEMVMVAESMFVGSSDKNTKSKKVQVASDKVGLMATTTAEMQQGDGKAVLTLDGGNLKAGASKNEINGNTTIAGKAEIKGEASAPSGKFDSLTAGKAFKSPNISDGMGVPSAAAAGKPSAKLKEEEAKK